MRKFYFSRPLFFGGITQSPGSDDLQVTELKRQKLRLKEEIERLSAEHEAA